MRQPPSAQALGYCQSCPFSSRSGWFGPENVARDPNGMWTAGYDGPAQVYWQIWARDSNNPTWSNTGDTQTSHFPAPDADIVPDGVTWWQVKFCGEDGDGNQSTPFSNVISFGPVPAA